MSKDEVLQMAIDELRGLSEACGKDLTEKTLKNLFVRKKAYQKDWPHIVLRRKALMIAGATMIAIGRDPKLDELTAFLLQEPSKAAV